VSEQIGPCFIVFGVSGIGKSTACRKFANAHPEFLYVQASSLLSEASQTDPEVLRRASKAQILINQDLIVEAFRGFRAGRLERPVLLDAHAVIDNDQSFVEVPVAVISAFEPAGLILMDSTPETVSFRRDNDLRRRPKRNKAQIARGLEAERSAVARYAKLLGVPSRTLRDGDQSSLELAVRELERIRNWRS
jgi:adenylate kinase